MKKKLLTIILSIFMIMGTFTTRVFAADSKTVSELLSLAENSFPTTLENAWTDGQGNSLFVSNNKLCVKLDGEQNPRELIGLDASASYYYGYYIEDGDVNLYFYLENEDSGTLNEIEYMVYEPEYNNYHFSPSITVQEYLGNSISDFPTNFNDAWTDYNGRNLYIANNALGAYDSNNTLIDSISLSSKTTTSSLYLYGENGGNFFVEFTGDGDIDYFYFEPFDYSYGTYIYPRCFVMDLMPDNYPSGSVPWLNDNKAKIYIYYESNPSEGIFVFYDGVYTISDATSISFKDMDFTEGVNKYTCTILCESGQDVTITINLNASGITESITVEGFSGEYDILNGTFTAPPPVYVSDIVSQSMEQFPTSKDIGWTDGFDNYTYVSNEKLVIDLFSGVVEHISLNKLANLGYSDIGYESYTVNTDEGSNVFLDINYGYFNTIAYETPDISYIVMSPLNVYTILPENFPWVNDEENYWIDGTGNKLYMTNVNPRFEFSNSDGSVSFIPYCDPQSTFLTKVSENTYKAYDVVCDIDGGVYVPTDDDIAYTLITNEYGELIKINISVEGEYSSLNGTYQSPKTIEDVLALSEYVFPSTKEKGWKIDDGDSSIYLTESGSLKFNDTVMFDDVSNRVSIDGSNYKYVDGSGLTITFNMDNNVLKSFVISNAIGSLLNANGTYLPPDPIEYEIIEGTNIVIDISEGGDGYFRSNADYSLFYDEALYKILGKVYIDGKFIKPYYYEHNPGSTIIIIYNSYLKNLSNGTHILKIVSSDGFAETTFTVKNNENPTPSPGLTPSSNSTSKYRIPNTGVE